VFWSWLQIQRSQGRFPALPDFLKSSGCGAGVHLASWAQEEQLEKNSSGSGLENREHGCDDSLRWPRDTLYLQKLALTSPIRGGRSVGKVHSQTDATAFSLVFTYTACFCLYDCHQVLKLFCIGKWCASFMLVQVFFHMQSHLCTNVSHSYGQENKYTLITNLQSWYFQKLNNSLK
jgi:hypothetical protein